jgi:hypothetical protein
MENQKNEILNILFGRAGCGFAACGNEKLQNVVPDARTETENFGIFSMRLRKLQIDCRIYAYEAFALDSTIHSSTIDTLSPLELRKKICGTNY